MLFSDEEILGNLLTMLVAGEDTTAHTMAWMVHFMADAPVSPTHLMQHEVRCRVRRGPDVAGFPGA